MTVYSLGRLRWLSLAASLVGILTPVTAAPAQTRWVIDTKASLAWFQVDPHLNHLWGTTCPQEPTWRPGEGRSSGWHVDPNLETLPSGDGSIRDTVHIPLYPRHRVRSVCTEAVKGQLLLPDTVRWRGARGEVTVRSDALVTGVQMRDVAMHQLLQSSAYSEINFTLDSLVSMTKQADTLRGSAVGTLTVRGVRKPTTAAVRAYPVAGGTRVFVKWHIPALDLDELTPLLKVIGLGVNTRMWKDFYMGADLVFRPEPTGAN